jgi:hypothetical protein
VFSRDQTCRGKSQTPCSLDGRVEGNRDSEAHRQDLLGEITSHRAVMRVNAKWPRKQMNPGAEPANEGRRQHGVPKSNRCGILISAGCKRQHGDKDMPSNWRRAPRSGEKSLEQGRSYNRLNRKSIDGERVADGSAVQSDFQRHQPSLALYEGLNYRIPVSTYTERKFSVSSFLPFSTASTQSDNWRRDFGATPHVRGAASVRVLNHHKNTP